ncbi:MAG: circularly permuted type 2 ATP-grasp protein [bacterium]
MLTPGRFNSAYFEHGFLARTTGALVEPGDLFVGAGDRLRAHRARPDACRRDLPPHRRGLPDP